MLKVMYIVGQVECLKVEHIFDLRLVLMLGDTRLLRKQNNSALKPKCVS